MDAREVLIIISGVHKAHALARCIEEGVNHMYTVSCVQMHPKAMIVCDEDATLELRVRTVKYFKGIERVHDDPSLKLRESVRIRLNSPLRSASNSPARKKTKI